METERWQKIDSIYHAALDQDPGRREEFVQQACGADEPLRKEIESLLAESDDGEDFLEVPALHVAARVLASSTAASGETATPGSHPAFIGRYRVIRLLGEGGMGTVYEAEQEDPRRVVALKVIRPGLATPERMRRFRHESQALGRLQHPGIAQIYDAGTADTGYGPQPYFAMELIRGESLDRYAAAHPLSVREKLALMVRVCEAVHHAHQRGLIHRDLKPGNILIDETGQPKILDFGVARLTEAEGQLTVQTEVGQIVGTLAYMSPEQVTGDPLEIDTRSDVYSLGVILYELLSGQPPYSVSGRKIPEAVHIIREVDPASLSSISRNCRGDVETIVGKALEKDKSRRYESAAALAGDIKHYLRDEPILARPPSTSYQLAKFARRNRALVMGIAAVFLVLVVGIAVSTTLAIRARAAERAALEERDRANRERDRATRITDFMTRMFKVSDPGEARGNSVTAREILDKASNDLTTGLASDPDAQSQMMKVMAGTYMNLGLLNRARDLTQKSFDIRQNVFGQNDPRTLESMAQVGDILEQEGKFDEAEKLERQAFTAEQRVLGSEDDQTLYTMNLLVVVIGDQGRFAEAEKLDREQVSILTRKVGAEDQKTFAARTNLAGLLAVQARYAEAEKENRALVEVGRRRWGSDHPRTLAVMDNLGMALRQEGHLSEAEQIFRQDLAARQRVEGPEHPATLVTMQNLADAVSSQGRFVESEGIYRALMDISSRTLGQDYPHTLEDESSLAGVLLREGRVEEARSMFQATLAKQLKVLGPENPDTLSSRSGLVQVLIAEHRYDLAEPMARQIYEVQSRVLGPQYPDTIDSLQLLATSLAHSHRYPEAAKMFQLILTSPDASQPVENSWRGWYAFACVANAAGREDDALNYLREAVHRGYSDVDGLMNDDDLKSLRQNPHFKELVATLRRSSKALQGRPQ